MNESERRLDNKSNVWKRVSGNGKRGLKIERDNNLERREELALAIDEEADLVV